MPPADLRGANLDKRVIVLSVSYHNEDVILAALLGVERCVLLPDQSDCRRRITSSPGFYIQTLEATRVSFICLLLQMFFIATGIWILC